MAVRRNFEGKGMYYDWDVKAWRYLATKEKVSVGGKGHGTRVVLHASRADA